MSDLINIAGDGVGVSVWEFPANSTVTDRLIGCVVDGKMMNLRFGRDTSVDRIARTFVTISELPQMSINSIFGGQS